jgi:PAS domain S-box-containing protein
VKIHNFAGEGSTMKKTEIDWKLVFIDDEEGIRTVMSIVLADVGYKVITAESGERGIELCKEHSPQIVITDIRMPGMDGIEVLRKIKEKDPNLEVIVVTAFGEMDVAIKALQYDASDFITKPINDEALFVALERAKSRYTTRKELQDYTTLLEKRWMDTAEELAKTFIYQNNLIESSIDGIMGCDKEGMVIIYNKSLENILGYPKDEVIKKMHYDQFFPVGGAENFRKALDSEDYGGKNRLFLYEANLVGKNGGKIPVQLSATGLFEGEEEIGMVGFFRDLREMRRLEQEFADQARLLHQDKMITLGRLAASVVHEINNPLAGILNYLRLMIKILSRHALDQEQMEKFQRYLNLVESETSRCSRIVSNLLAFSRKSETEFKEIDLHQLLQKCIMLSQHKLDLQNIQIRTNLDAHIPNVWGDFNQIQQCLINLIFNAIDAMPSGGTLSIVFSHDKNRNMVEIMVRDTGSGIAKEDVPHIFDPFYTTKMEGKGLGLGLATVQGIIERHKGMIQVDSEMGKGTAFIIRLPV